MQTFKNWRKFWIHNYSESRPGGINECASGATNFNLGSQTWSIDLEVNFPVLMKNTSMPVRFVA